MATTQGYVPGYPRCSDDSITEFNDPGRFIELRARIRTHDSNITAFVLVLSKITYTIIWICFDSSE